MKAKKLIGTLHLWLGLFSGLVIFILAITGCIYAFQQEIQDLTQPYRFVETQQSPLLPPSTLREIADAQLPGKHIHGILYGEESRAATAIYFSYPDHYYDFVYLNPYTGEVQKVVDVYDTFFRIVLDGHFYLWLPPDIGQPLVASATLIFVVLLFSGIYLWWPRSKGGLKKHLTIKWNARWRRKNYDLHQVFGFYVSWLALILAITGLVWGFEWFKEGLYATVGGEKSLVYQEPLSDTTAQASTGTPAQAVDLLWNQVRSQYPAAGTIEMHFPEGSDSPIHVAINPDPSTYWKIDYLYFDQYTLKEVSVDHIWNRFDEATPADKLMRLNYDIHVGAIGGLAGKTLAFFVSLLVASLPVTGFLLWLGRRNKSKQKNKGSESKNKKQIPLRRKQLSPNAEVLSR